MDARERLLHALAGDREFSIYVRDRTVLSDRGCVEWIGDQSHGYGVVGFRKTRQLAHRAVMARLGNSIVGKAVCHRCDNPPCVNPDHLMVGDEQVNLRDASSKDRLSRKLNNKKAAEIRQKYASHLGSYRSLAKEYGVSKAMIRDVVKNRRWAWAV